MNNLIAISGKMGSGKDTVALIIQALTGTGFGDDKAFKIFKETGMLPISTNKSPFVIKKFAGKLKDVVCLLIGCTREDLENSEFKSTPMNATWDNSHGISTPRELLQVLGTDCGRDMIHPDLWPNALFVDYTAKYIGGIDPIDDQSKVQISKHYPSWIISDLRFPNELTAVESRNGITIRVNRPSLYMYQGDTLTLGQLCKEVHKDTGEYPTDDYSNKTWLVPVSTHESETALDDAAFDYIINNEGTIEELIEKVKEILILEKSILEPWPK